MFIGADARAVRPYMRSRARHLGRSDNQRLTLCVSISPILHGNLTHFAVQYGPFYRTIWLVWKTDMTVIPILHAFVCR